MVGMRRDNQQRLVRLIQITQCQFDVKEKTH